MIKIVRGSMAIAVFILMQVLSYADVYKIDFVVNNTSIIESERARWDANEQMKMSVIEPDNVEVVVIAMNSEMVAREGMSYSYPATVFVELSNNNEIIKYKLEYFSPYIHMNDPNFSIDKPNITYNDFITILQTSSSRTVKQENVVNNTTIFDIYDDSDEGYLKRTLPEIWIPYFETYISLNRGDYTPVSESNDIIEYKLNGNVLLDKNNKEYTFSSANTPSDIYSKFSIKDVENIKLPLRHEYSNSSDKHILNFTNFEKIDESNINDLFILNDDKKGN